MTETETTSVGYARIEQPFGVEPPITHCPICGHALIGPDGSQPCHHLAFIYVGAAGDFEYQSDSFQAAWSDLDIDEVEFNTFPQHLAEAGCDNKLLAIELTYGGMGHGPAWYTDVYGFDYSTLAAEDK